MNPIRSFLLSCCVILMTISGPALAGDTGDSVRIGNDQIQLPPASLAEWYKPLNKRQVWLHTMFRLRQSMQAVELYLQRDDAEQLARWADKLQKTYAKIPEMVPEWTGASRQPIARSLLQAAQRDDRIQVAKDLKRLQKFCDGCHMEWQPLVSAIYRSPDYSKAVVIDSLSGNSLHYPEAMQQLSQTLGVLKISREDGALQEARAMTRQLQRQLADLGEGCADCHRDDLSAERILGAEIQQAFTALEQALHEPHEPKQSGRALGTIGFKVCGRCHSIHRTLGDLRNWITR